MIFNCTRRHRQWVPNIWTMHNMKRIVHNTVSFSVRVWRIQLTAYQYISSFSCNCRTQNVCYIDCVSDRIRRDAWGSVWFGLYWIRYLTRANAAAAEHRWHMQSRGFSCGTMRASAFWTRCRIDSYTATHASSLYAVAVVESRKNESNSKLHYEVMADIATYRSIWA